MDGPLAAPSAAALDVAFPFRLTVDARMTVVARGPALGAIQIGERADDALRLRSPARPLGFEALRALAGTEVEIEVRGGQVLVAVVADDVAAGVVHLLARAQGEAGARRDRAGDLLRELATLREAGFEDSLRRIVGAAADALDIERVSYWRL